MIGRGTCVSPPSLFSASYVKYILICARVCGDCRRSALVTLNPLCIVHRTRTGCVLSALCKYISYRFVFPSLLVVFALNAF